MRSRYYAEFPSWKLFVYVVAALIGLFAASVANGQPPDEPKVCISQEAANKCVTAAAELIEARKVIVEFQKADALSQAERQAAQALIKGLNDLIAIKDRKEAAMEAAFEFAQKVIAFQNDLITDLQNRINKPKSGFQKFMDALKTIGYILAGAGLGRLL